MSFKSFKKSLEGYKFNLDIRTYPLTAVKMKRCSTDRSCKVFYFDENNIYRCGDAKLLYGYLDNLYESRYSDDLGYCTSDYTLKIFCGLNGDFNSVIQNIILSKLKVGDSIYKAYEIALFLSINDYSNSHLRCDGVYKYLSSNKVSIRFTPAGEKYFEYMFVEMSCISSVTVDDIRHNKELFDAYVLSVVEDNEKFKKYGISINFLKLGNVVLTADKRLQYTFELKEKLNEICKVD